MLIPKVGRASCILATALVGYFAFALNIAVSQAEDPLSPNVLRALALKSTNSLKTVKVVDAPTFNQFVVNRAALQQLGKALFWDQKVGSDGQSCASCHFHAGADNRSKNQINPGFKNTLIPDDAKKFGPSYPNQLMENLRLKPNYQLTHEDFPFHKLADPNNRNSTVLADTSNVVSSQGVFNATFTGLRFDLASSEFSDIGTPVKTIFQDASNDAMVRNVEPRNTPTVINAVLNHRNFWDGRGRNEFNGVNPLGSLEPSKIVKVPSRNQVVFVQTRISDSSGASQAAGPPGNHLEMSFAGRTFAHIGRKMLAAGVTPLEGQTIDPTDSVLGGNTLMTSSGGKKTYVDLIKAAFNPTWWDAPAGWVVNVPTEGDPKLLQSAVPDATNFTVMEYNFGLFMSMAINEYEKLLIANDSPFDRFMEGKTDLTLSERQGLRVFLTNGKCINCHGGAEMTNASLSNVQGFQVLERMIMGNDRVAVYDNGFYNIGVRPTGEDLGVGDVAGSKNRPLSNSRFYQNCVNDALWASPSLSLAQANDRCGVPRILARIEDAAKLLSKAAGLAGNPPQVIALLNEANRLFSTVPSDPVQGSCRLAKNPALPCPFTEVLNSDGTRTVTQLDGALDVLRAQFPSVGADLLASAESLLPDTTRPGTASKLLAPVLGRSERVAVDGAFKTPTTRNVEFTAPYFHNGGAATLEQVVQFYNRGGDFAVQNRDNVDPDIQPLNLSSQDQAALVAFLKTLTDDRVKLDKAPFDHPSLDIPNGGTFREGISPYTYYFGSGSARIMDDRVVLPAVGKAGLPLHEPLGTPNTPFANFLDSLTRPPPPAAPPTGQ